MFDASTDCHELVNLEEEMMDEIFRDEQDWLPYEHSYYGDVLVRFTGGSRPARFESGNYCYDHYGKRWSFGTPEGKVTYEMDEFEWKFSDQPCPECGGAQVGNDGGLCPVCTR